MAAVLAAQPWQPPQWSSEDRKPKRPAKETWLEGPSTAAWCPPTWEKRPGSKQTEASRPDRAQLPSVSVPIRAPPCAATASTSASNGQQPLWSRPRPIAPPVARAVDADEQLWSEIVSEALDGERFESTFELSRRGIRSVCPIVRDLRLMTRLGDANASPDLAGLAEIKLYLGSNLLTTPRISNSLWMLHNLVVLSLRENQLHDLPSGIGRLVNLRELNVGGNNLQCLPSEIQNLTLSVLNITPNPFLSPPNGTDVATAASAWSPLARQSCVPSLVELCQRLLLRPCEPPSPSLGGTLGGTFSRNSSVASITGADGFGGGPSRVAHTCQGELSDLPKHLYRPFREVMATPEPGLAGYDPLSSLCASGRCLKHLARPHDALFVTPCEERIQFTRHVAGVDMSMLVPLRWRGCSAGCLDFLESL